MPFCPNCRYEYKPEVWKCPDCGARLVDRLPEEEPAQNIEEESAKSTDFVRLRSFPSSLDARMLQGALENEGIPSVIKGEGDEVVPAAFGGAMHHLAGGGVIIWVPKEHLERSEKIAEQMFGDI